MRRHPVLRDLSSEHHAGLVMARRASLAAGDVPAVRAAAWAELAERFRAELDPHFRREEALLLPALRAAGERGLVERTLAEHAAMRRLIVSDRAEGLAEFAELLRAHIRFEEQVLFECAQRRLDPAELAALGEWLGAKGPPACQACDTRSRVADSEPTVGLE